MTEARALETALSGPALALVCLAFGLVVGSFLNVVIHRLPREESIAWPGSRCPSCARPIRPWENVPVLSWLWLRGRCAGCQRAISARYPAMELATGLLFAAVAWRIGATPMLPVWLVFGAALLAAAVIDAEHRIIPDEISLGGLGFGLVVVPFVRQWDGTPLQEAWLHGVSGAVLGGGLLWTVGFVHARVSAVFGRTFEHWPGDGAAHPRPTTLDYWVWFPGLGFGDVKLLGMIGAFLGPVGVIETILAASLLGLVLGAVIALGRGRWDAPFGFGPALAAGALCALLVPHPPLLGL